MIVADTNLIAYLLIPGAFTATAEAVFRKDPEWAAPPLWRSEMRNVLWMYIRSGQASVADALALMAGAEEIMRRLELTVESAPVLTLAAASGCSAYDCEFVHLAQTYACPLVTADRTVLQAFPESAVSLEDFVR